MNRPITILCTALLAATLAGCGGATSSQPAATVTVQASSSASAAPSDPSPTPSASATPAAASTDLGADGDDSLALKRFPATIATSGGVTLTLGVPKSAETYTDLDNPDNSGGYWLGAYDAQESGGVVEIPATITNGGMTAFDATVGFGFASSAGENATSAQLHDADAPVQPGRSMKVLLVAGASKGGQVTITVSDESMAVVGTVSNEG